MYPPVEASSGQEWHYLRSGCPLVRHNPIKDIAWPSLKVLRSGWPLVRHTSLMPWPSNTPLPPSPSRDISWPSLVLLWAGWPLVRCTPNAPSPLPPPPSRDILWQSLVLVWAGWPLVRCTPCPKTPNAPTLPNGSHPIETSHGEVCYSFGQVDLWSDFFAIAFLICDYKSSSLCSNTSDWQWKAMGKLVWRENSLYNISLHSCHHLTNPKPDRLIFCHMAGWLAKCSWQAGWLAGWLPIKQNINLTLPPGRDILWPCVWQLWSHRPDVPPLETSHGQVWYYCEQAALQSDVPPSP